MKSFFTRFFILCSVLLASLYANPLKASHMEGADLRFRCLGGNQYEVTLSFYRDCSGIDHLTSVNINIASVTCGQTLTLTANRISVVEVSPLCPSQLSQSTCNGGTLPGVQLQTYVGTITLPAACRDWIVSWRDGNRNNSITNISLPSSAYMYVEGLINNLDVSCNSSPDFTTPPVPYICNGVPFSYNHGVIDPEGDSLRYTMIAPLDNAGVPITYTGSFSVASPMNMTGGLVFDPATGQMSFTPNGVQIVALAVRVDEYRNGRLIGSVIRDMQVVVINCTNSPPVANAPTGVTGGTLSGNTFSTCPNNTLRFNITGTDANATDIITAVNTITSNLPGATVVVAGTNPISLAVTWPVPASPLPSYNFSITFQDNACPIRGQQTVGYLVVTGPQLTITPSSASICPGQNVTLTAGTATNYIWSTGATTSSIVVAPVVNTTYSVTGTVAGCVARGVVTVTMASSLPLAISATSTNLCAGQSATLTAGAATNYVWSTGAVSQSITVSPSSATVYTVSATIGTCSALGSITITTGSVTGSGVTICQGGSGSLTSSYGCPSISGTSIAQSTTFNSGALTSTDPTYVRPYSGTSCSSSGTTTYYDVFTFTVSTAGSYTFNGCFPTIDAYGHIYQNAFSPTSPCGIAANYVTGDDDTYSTCTSDPSMTVTLSPGITYYLVSESYSTLATDTYSWTYTGPVGATIATGTPGTLQWYTAASGGSPIGTGTSFNPVGVAGSGLANTNTPGTTTYYLACSNDPTCRTGVNFTIGTVTATGVNICQGGSGSLTSSYACPPSSTSIAQGATFNSGTLASTDPTYIRPYSGTSCSNSSTTTYYDVFTFTVSTAGSYTFNGCFPTIDAYGHIYQNAFNPTTPCAIAANYVTGDDDTYTTCSADPAMTVTLTPGITYYLISESYSSLGTGAYSWTYTGPVGATISTGGGAAGILQWYTAASGGTAIGTGSPFNPVGVAGSGLANTSTAGTTTYYVACSSNPTCRTAVNYVITAGSTPITSVPVSSPLCPNTNVTLTASGGTSAAGAVINWYTGPNGTGTLLGTGSSITYAPAATTTIYVRREGGCSGATADFAVNLNVMTYIYAANGTTTNTYCTDNAGWNHFYTGSNIIFSVQGNIAGAAVGFPRATIYVSGTSYYQSPGIIPSCVLTPGPEKFEMKRSWNLDMGGSGNVGPYSVRFYYQPAERTAIETAAANWMSTYAACGYTYKYAVPLGFYWFKNTGSNYVAPLYDATHYSATIGTTPNGINYSQWTGVPSFSGGSGAVILQPSVLLANEYKYFTGEIRGSIDHLTWATASETNNARFEVERSTDGINFEKIGQVAGSGTTSEFHSYQFDDSQPIVGMNYYRLRQIDYDGNAAYSNTIALEHKAVDYGHQFFPNPTESEVTYQFNTGAEEDVQVEVIDILGRRLEVREYHVGVGLNNISVDLSNYTAGAYVIRAMHKSTNVSHIKTITKVNK